eukprot:14012227-Ditylum_brightwellii.AAC.1
MDGWMRRWSDAAGWDAQALCAQTVGADARLSMAWRAACAVVVGLTLTMSRVARAGLDPTSVCIAAEA